MKSSRYTLTKSAEADLDEIYARSLAQFGRAQTNLFMADFKRAAEFAADHIGKLPTRTHLVGESGLSLYPVNNHYLAYRPVGNNHIVIIAIFRQARDIPALITAEAEKFQKDFLEIEQKIRNGAIVITTT